MEGYSSRQSDMYSSYSPRDSYGSGSQRTDSQRGSYGRDQYTDDTRRGYSDEYMSPGSKRDLPSKDSPWYRDQAAVESKRGRYADYPTSYQSSESQFQSSERRPSEQVDPYGRGSARGYSSESSLAAPKSSTYDSSYSSQYAPSRYDSSSRYGSSEQSGDRKFSGADQSRSGDQR